MPRLFLALVILGAVGLPALGQSLTATQSQSETTTSLSDATPQENASGGSVANRSPGTWVKAAIARHSNLMQQRLRGPRFGQPNTEEAQLRAGGTGTATGTSTDLGGLAGLLSLASQFGSAGSLGDLGDLLGGLTGTGTSTTSTTTGTGSTTIPAPSNGTSYTLQDLIAMGQMFGGGSGQSSTSRSLDGAASGSKTAARSQETSEQTQATEETDFKTRWANAMLQTFFSAVTLGLQSTQFIDAIKDALRPLVLPPAESDGSGNGNGTGNGSGNGSGNGIENLPSNGGNGGSSTL